jgi:hypothetical protein
MRSATAVRGSLMARSIRHVSISMLKGFNKRGPLATEMTMMHKEAAHNDAATKTG